jgi:single-strand DNA-binding protein
MQASGLIASVNAGPDIPVTIRAYGNSGTTLGTQAIGASLLASGRMKIVKNGDSNEPVFIISSFPPSANLITIVGRLGSDPEIKYLESGKSVAKGSIAVSEGKNDPPSWYNYEAWGKDAELLVNYCRKGSQLALSGPITMENWTDKTTGSPRSKIVIKVSQVAFCGSKNDEQGSSSSAQPNYNPAPTASQQPQKPASKQPQEGYDDIPF